MITQYAQDNVHKTLTLTIGGTTITNANIVSESMELKEAVVDGDNFEFVGCISSQFKVQLHGIYINLKGQSITATIQADGTAAITIFHGIIDSVELESNHDYQTITAYDVLYTKGNTDIASWYKGLTFPITLGNFRNSLFNYIGLTQVSTTLPNDDIQIKRKYKPSTLQAIIVIKSICQINGVFGIINRDGEFEYRTPQATVQSEGTYPAADLYPPFYPGMYTEGSTNPEYIATYNSIDYQAYTVKPVDKLTIREDEEDDGQSYGAGDNNYIIQGNMFSYGLKAKDIQKMAQNIYPNIQGINFTPFNVVHNGFPEIEVGVDFVQYHVLDYEASALAGSYVFKTVNFPVYNRSMKGIQHLVDNYEARGEEYQRQFITDLNAQIELLKKNNTTDLSNYYDKTEIDTMFNDYSGGGGGGTGTGWSVQSVAELPATGQANVLYLVQGEVVVT